ncbi:hypothetical protein KM043_015346 [Ampulex compressa]|nr:hypothetical protein KM043_015346 [Ampulex compressa]
MDQKPRVAVAIQCESLVTSPTTIYVRKYKTKEPSDFGTSTQKFIPRNRNFHRREGHSSPEFATHEAPSVLTAVRFSSRATGEHGVASVDKSEKTSFGEKKDNGPQKRPAYRWPYSRRSGEEESVPATTMRTSRQSDAAQIGRKSERWALGAKDREGREDRGEERKEGERVEGGENKDGEEGEK